MQTVIEQHLQAPVGLFLVFLQTLKASIGIGLANFQVSMFCEFRLDLYKKIKLFFVLCKYIYHTLIIILTAIVSLLPLSFCNIYDKMDYYLSIPPSLFSSFGIDTGCIKPPKK